jgi:hypothetical protein
MGDNLVAERVVAHVSGTKCHLCLGPLGNQPAVVRIAADSPLRIGLVPGMIIGDPKKGSDHAIPAGEYLGKD